MTSLRSGQDGLAIHYHVGIHVTQQNFAFDVMPIPMSCHVEQRQKMAKFFKIQVIPPWDSANSWSIPGHQAPQQPNLI